MPLRLKEAGKPEGTSTRESQRPPRKPDGKVRPAPPRPGVPTPWGNVVDGAGSHPAAPPAQSFRNSSGLAMVLAAWRIFSSVSALWIRRISGIS